MDPDGCMRLTGRLSNTELPYNQQHPYLLPARATLSQRLMEDAHLRTLHGHTQVCMQYLREKFWITGVRNGLKMLIHSCPRCVRYQGRTSDQLMGDLPADRARLNRPFLFCGVDYAGPFTIWARTGRNMYVEQKAYVAVFVCCSTRAVHLELVSDATTQARQRWIDSYAVEAQ